MHSTYVSNKSQEFRLQTLKLMIFTIVVRGSHTIYTFKNKASNNKHFEKILHSSVLYTSYKHTIKQICI